MRMWKVHPKVMCRKHLLGEHLEMHMFAGTISKGKRIDGYINKGLVEVHSIFLRHQILAREMIRRGYNHNSPMVFKDMLTNNNPYRRFNTLLRLGKVNTFENYHELARRCPECRRLQNAHQ